jgi:cardiolipin synthase
MRIVLVAPTLMYIMSGRYDLALVLFLVAGFSDGVDGFLAKRFDWHTRIGALLDPIADKLLVGGTFVTMVFAGLVPIWLAALVILRDIVIVGGATAYNVLVRPLEGEPTRISKLNTVLQLLFIVFVLSNAGFGWPDQIAITVIGAGVLVTLVVSGIDYVWSWSRRAREDRQPIDGAGKSR